jgi:hypothetical protein
MIGRLHLIADIWWLTFWEIVLMGKIPTIKEAENRRVFGKCTEIRGNL